MKPELTKALKEAIIEESGSDSIDVVNIKETRKDPKVPGCYVVLADLTDGTFEKDSIFIINNHNEGKWEVIDCSTLEDEEVKTLRGLKFGEPRFF